MTGHGAFTPMPGAPGDAKPLLAEIFARAVASVRGDLLIARNAQFDGRRWRYASDRGEVEWDLPPKGRVIVVGAGKAAASLALGLEQVLGDRIDDGCLVVKYGHSEPLQRIRQIEAAHPVPDAQSVAGTRELLRTLDGLTSADRVFILLTGGASSLLVSPIDGISLVEKAAVTQLLLRSGASIDEMNGIRKLLSRVKGGRLLDRIHPAESMTLLVSDVPNGDYGTIGSGPTIRDHPPAIDPFAIFDRYGIRDQVPESIRTVLNASPLRPARVGVTAVPRSEAILVAESATLVDAVERIAAELGLHSERVDVAMDGSTHAAAQDFAAALLAAAALPGDRKPRLLISAGETTLQVRGKGKGGRNQEFALVAASMLAGRPRVALLAAGTDGTDGPTDAAGAFVDGTTCARAAAAGIDVAAMLADNDSYQLFQALGDLHVTGASGTNVMDLVLGIAG